MEKVLVMQIIVNSLTIWGNIFPMLKAINQHSKDFTHITDKQMQFQHLSLLFQ